MTAEHQRQASKLWFLPRLNIKNEAVRQATKTCCYESIRRLTYRTVHQDKNPKGTSRLTNNASPSRALTLLRYPPLR